MSDHGTMHRPRKIMSGSENQFKQKNSVVYIMILIMTSYIRLLLFFFRILKGLLINWIQEVFTNQNDFADSQLIHFYRYMPNLILVQFKTLYNSVCQKINDLLSFRFVKKRLAFGKLNSH